MKVIKSTARIKQPNMYNMDNYLITRPIKRTRFMKNRWYTDAGIYRAQVIIYFILLLGFFIWILLIQNVLYYHSFNIKNIYKLIIHDHFFIAMAILSKNACPCFSSRNWIFNSYRFGLLSGPILIIFFTLMFLYSLYFIFEASVTPGTIVPE